MEVAHFLERYADLKTKAGHQRVVRHGHLPEREIMTGIGSVAVRQPRVRDREAVGGERIGVSPTILPPYARRTKSLEVLIPILYLKGISTGDFEEALAALLGKDAGGLSASTIARLKEAWVDEHARWLDRDLSAKRYVYFWVDGIHVQARLEDDAQCLLVIIGATPEGKKELVGRPTVCARAQVVLLPQSPSKYPPAEPGALGLEPLKAACPCCPVRLPSRPALRDDLTVCAEALRSARIAAAPLQRPPPRVCIATSRSAKLSHSSIDGIPFVCLTARDSEFVDGPRQFDPR